MTPLDHYLSTSAAARIANVSDESVRNWMRKGLLEYTPTPLGRLISPADLAHVVIARAARREL
jgi:predicted site-specific integrase-resolvase